MAKISTTLFIIVLVCSITLINSSRPIPVSHHENEEMVNVKVDDNESCEGVNEEECLMRRTLVAHTDYIYTQHKNP